MPNNYQSQVDAAKSAIDTIILKTQELDKELLKVIASLGKVNSLKTPSDISEGLNKQGEQIKNLNELIKKQQTQIEKLSNAKSKLNKISLIEKDTRQKSLKALKLQATSNNRLVSSYERLIAQKKRMKSELDRLTVSYGKNSAQVKKLQSSYDKVVGKSNKVNKAFISLSKGGIRGAIGGIKSLMGAFGVFGGATLAASLIPNLFKLTKQFDAFRFAMSKTIPDTIELSRTTEFLDQITQDFGADLVTTTERYIKFDAAARQSNVSLEKTQKIFGTVTKAAGVLGLKTHELEGVYLALEQMLSKGKVTTEELRRQLGERLPGAFGIMADAVGVSTAKLDKMLRAGEILSKDALPKFAVALEKAYGIESVKKVDTLQAAQTRLSNAWAMFVRDISDDDSILQSVFKGTLNFMSNLLEGIEDIGDEIKEAFKTEAIKSLEKESNSFLETQKKQVDSLNTYQDANERINEAIRQRFALEDNLANSIFENQKKILGNENASIENAEAEAKGIVKRMAKYKDYKKFVEDLGLREDIFDKNRIATIFAKIKGIDSVIDKSNEELESERLKNEELEKGNKKIGKRAKIKSVISDDLQKETETFKKALEQQIEMFEEALELYPKLSKEYIQLSEAIKSLKKASEGIDVSIAFDGIEEGIEQANREAERLEESLNSLKDFREGFATEFFSEAGFDFTGDFLMNFDEMTQMIKDGGDQWEDYFNVIAEMAQEAFNFISQNQAASFDAQYERLEKEKQTALLFAGESDAAKQRIEEQAEARKKALQRREAKAQKELAIVNTVINTAQAVVATLGQTGFAGIPLSVIVGAIGAAQVALIASQKIPEFWRGTMNAPEGVALVDEKRPEVHTDKHGKVKSFGSEKGANHRFLEKGDKIYKSRELYFEKELNGVLGDNNILPYNEFMSIPNVVVPDNGIKAGEMDAIIGRHFSKIQINETKIDKNGVTTLIRNSGGETEILNNRTSFKGFSV